MPQALTVTLADLLYFEKSALPQALANRLIRLVAFQNPEFYKAQAMRMSVWDKRRVISSAENYPQHIALPRGCLNAALALLKDNGIRCDLQDERFAGEPVQADFVGTQQYAGRLHREHTSKASVRIVDFVDTGHPALLRMWEKRQRAYRATGYRVGVDASDGRPRWRTLRCPVSYHLRNSLPDKRRLRAYVRRLSER